MSRDVLSVFPLLMVDGPDASLGLGGDFIRRGPYRFILASFGSEVVLGSVEGGNDRQ